MNYCEYSGGIEHVYCTCVGAMKCCYYSERAHCDDACKYIHNGQCVNKKLNKVVFEELKMQDPPYKMIGGHNVFTLLPYGKSNWRVFDCVRSMINDDQATEPCDGFEDDGEGSCQYLEEEECECYNEQMRKLAWERWQENEPDYFEYFDD